VIIETFPVGWLQCNCTILGDPASGEAIVVDPGDEFEKVMAALDRHHLRCLAVVNTHTHIDHVGAIQQLQERLQTPAAIHKADLVLFENLEMQAQFIGMPAPKRGVIDQYLQDGSAVACRGVEVGVIHTPGHTPGSTSFHLPGDRNILFTGDTLFAESIGRTDLGGGSHPQILTSIHKKLMTFDDDTLVIAGHGESTTIGHERRYNPFLK